jgi:2-oxoglutarate dehydrogenase E1 component
MVKENKLPYEYQEPELAWKQLKKNATIEDMMVTPVTGVDLKQIQSLLENLINFRRDLLH